MKSRIILQKKTREMFLGAEDIEDNAIPKPE